MCRARDSDALLGQPWVGSSAAPSGADSACCVSTTGKGSAATARRRAMNAAPAQPCALHHEPQPFQQAPKPMQRVIMTRSRSRSAASALPASACQGKDASATQESQKLRPCPAIPDIPNGPLVISAGWGRTGTSSLKVALDSLGYSPCFHARFFPYLTEFFDTLYEHAVGRRPDFPAKRLFRQFNSAVDIPAPLIPMVMQAYPDAKVILSVRDPDKWYDSYVASLLWLYSTWWFKPFSWCLPMGWKLQAIGRWWLMWEFGNDTMADRDACIKAYLQHNERIKASVAPDQLLVWQAKDGWEPLCRFLGVDTPDTPFPRRNEGASEMAWQIVRFIVKNPLAVMGVTKYQHKGPLDFDAGRK